MISGALDACVTCSIGVCTAATVDETAPDSLGPCRAPTSAPASSWSCGVSTTGCWRSSGPTSPGQWQLPQGGLHSGEEPLAAAWRELLRGDRPRPERRDGRRRVPGMGRLRIPAGAAGRQRPARSGPPLVPVRRDATPTSFPRPTASEFVAWQWVTRDWMLEHAADFRKAGYEQVLSVDMSDDLFSAAAADRLRQQAPLAARLRPTHHRRGRRAGSSRRAGTTAAQARRARPA